MTICTLEIFAAIFMLPARYHFTFLQTNPFVNSSSVRMPEAITISSIPSFVWWETETIRLLSALPERPGYCCCVPRVAHVLKALIVLPLPPCLLTAVLVIHAHWKLVDITHPIHRWLFYSLTALTALNPHFTV
jgi:hypothetical protein